jgi:hypothetical protein
MSCRFVQTTDGRRDDSFGLIFSWCFFGLLTAGSAFCLPTGLVPAAGYQAWTWREIFCFIVDLIADFQQLVSMKSKNNVKLNVIPKIQWISAVIKYSFALQNAIKMSQPFCLH